ncbi:MAG: type II CRISPR RNA-guided endonuclease Cas9, partial [Deltaproteobacteria bacterium]|nr:type II CRISPR RNA-guided endonuclease Cas9 [Deltaproteobacteria bacterium]
MQEETMVLGLDIGPNSIGWSLAGCRVLADGLPEEPFRLIDAGARVFQEGVDRTPQGSEKSRNVQRREARAARRLHQRRNSRRHDLKAVLQDAGLLPKDEAVVAALMNENPYGLRAKGLDEKLSLFEFGRAIYHLSQRR